MELVGPEASLRLAIVGYEYPASTEWWDANWLNVRVEVRHPRGRWSATAPCLLTPDLPELAVWLEEVAAGSPTGAVHEFIEPNLRFEVIGDGARRTLRVALAMELLPEWARERPDRDDELTLDFPVDAAQLRAAAGSLREQADRYPERGRRDG